MRREVIPSLATAAVSLWAMPAQAFLDLHMEAFNGNRTGRPEETTPAARAPGPGDFDLGPTGIRIQSGWIICAMDQRERVIAATCRKVGTDRPTLTTPQW